MNIKTFDISSSYFLDYKAVKAPIFKVEPIDLSLRVLYLDELDVYPKEKPKMRIRKFVAPKTFTNWLEDNNLELVVKGGTWFLARVDNPTLANLISHDAKSFQHWISDFARIRQGAALTLSMYSEDYSELLKAFTASTTHNYEFILTEEEEKTIKEFK